MEPERSPAVVFAPQPDPLASIVVSGWKSAPCLEGCLRSIAGHVRDVAYEVIVSLSIPDPEIVEMLETRVRGARVLAWPANVGFAGTCNRAESVARGEYVVLLNDDAEVEERWLETLVEAADEHPEAGAVGSRVLLADGTMQENGVVIWSDGSVTFVGHGEPPAGGTVPQGVTRVDYCSGVSLLVRRSAWKSVGGMDEGYYPAYYEDVDLCLKLEADGMDVLVQPASVVVHHGSTSPLRYREFLGNRNRRRLVARWSSLLESRPAPRPGDPEAIARAFRSAARRERAGGRVPGLADERTGPEQDVTGVFDRKEREIKDEYIAEMEGAFDLLEREVEELRGARAEFERQREQHAGLAAEIESLRSSRDDARCELEAVRSRAGYRIVDKVHSVLRRVPGVFHVVRWLLRTIQRPPRSKLDREGGRARVPTPSE